MHFICVIKVPYVVLIIPSEHISLRAPNPVPKKEDQARFGNGNNVLAAFIAYWFPRLAVVRSSSFYTNCNNLTHWTVDEFLPSSLRNRGSPRTGESLSPLRTRALNPFRAPRQRRQPHDFPSIHHRIRPSCRRSRVAEKVLQRPREAFHVPARVAQGAQARHDWPVRDRPPPRLHGFLRNGTRLPHDAHASRLVRVRERLLTCSSIYISLRARVGQDGRELKL